MRPLAPELDRRRAESRYRRYRTVSERQGKVLNIDGQKVVDFSSNDYLGLTQHPEVIAALQNSAAQFGVGSGAAHLISGHLQPHRQLEETLAEFLGYQRVLLFSTGYMANLGILTALAQRGDRVLCDRLNHASLLDGARLSDACLQRYRHANSDDLDRLLQKYEDRERLVVTDGVFSMDGNLAPLTKIVPLAQKAECRLIVDDAHGFGVLGERGAGVIEHFGINAQQVPILMGTLGKAIGSFGAFVASSQEVIETLIQQARSYIYTTALPPAIASATHTALKLMIDRPEIRGRLWKNIDHFRHGAAERGIPLSHSDSAIHPLLLGDEELAVSTSQRLFDAGFLVSAIRPPTVPEGSSRLRITLSAEHTSPQIEQLLDQLARITHAQG